VDEDGCDYEKATLCAFDNASSKDDQVTFLACMDESDDDALKAAKSCASSSNVDDAKIVSCFNGARGDALLSSASKLWNKAFPGRAYIPKVTVNGDDEASDKGNIISAICKYSKSRASVCKDSAVFRFCEA